MRLSLFVLLAAFASANALAVQASPKAASAKAEPTFSRATALPKWAQPLAAIPPTARTDPVVTRLSDVQAKAGPNPALLINLALQVNDPASLSEIGQYALSYFPSYQKLQLHRVAIIRAGQVMDRTAAVNVRLLERESGVEAGVYGGEKSVQLLLDDVRAGDTLWVIYSVEGENPVFGKRWASTFSWDRASPVELRRLTVLHPASQRIYWRQLGDIRAEAIEPVTDRVGDMERMRFEGRGLEAVQFEPSIPPDFIPVRRLQMSEYPDWQAVAVWADGLFPRVAASPGLKQLAARFGTGKTRLAQASDALHWVQEEIRYFSVSIGENSHRPQAPDTVLARRYGDCKDKTYLLVSLLSQLGISARPVLVNAAAPKVPGKLIPAPTMFDHVIVRIDIDGAVYYVDPTRTGQKGMLDKLPAVLPGAMGLVVAADTQSLLALPEDPDQSPLLEYIDNIAIASFDGDATLESRMVYRGGYADWARRRFPVMAAATLKKELLARYEKGYPGVTLVKAPKLVDDAGGERFEVVAHYTLPKPVTHENGRYSIEYDSQVLDDTVTVPAKVVRNFPYRLPQGQFRGRYRLNLTWPAEVRANDVPAMKSLDNQFFSISEEYSLRGNYVSYLMDFRLKSDQVKAAAMPELRTQAKKLNPFAAGRWNAREAGLALPGVLAHSYRNFELAVAGQRIEEAEARIAKGSDAENLDELCDLTLLAVQVAESVGPAKAAQLAALPDQLVKLDKRAGARRCLARVRFAQGRFAESVPLFQAEAPLKDDDALTPTLAWARFFGGDGKAALADMARYRAARAGAGVLDGLDVANSIALLQRVGAPVPADLAAFGRQFPDAPWPRPLAAMQVGAIGEDALVAVATALPSDARELALNEAWFFIGQRRLAAGDKAGAERAFRWFPGNGVRTTREASLAKHELAEFEPADPDYQAGIAAANRKDLAGAIEKFQQSAARGLAAAQARLAAAAFYGQGVKQDYSEAMRWGRLAANQGDAAAMNLLGNLFHDGLGVPKDDVAAYDWYRRAAEKGEQYALCNLGNFYLYGVAPVKLDAAKAFDYLSRSAELNNADAQARVAGLYLTGTGVPLNYSLALFWAHRASGQGSTAGHLRLADLFREGNGVKKDEARAAELTRFAAAAGDPDGMLALGFLHQRGAGVAKDPKLAFAWFEKAAHKGQVIAQLQLGLCYRDGDGVAADPDKAIMLMEKAGSSGYSYAYSFLADSFIETTGMPKDPARGLAYLRACADKGDRMCQQDLAMRLHVGRGVARDYGEAAEWYRKAADQGMELSRNNLADLYENGFGVPQDFRRALSLYRQAGSAGHPMGFISLGSMYERGSGVAANLQTAYIYFQIAMRLMGGADKDADTAARQAKLAGQLSAAQRAEAEVLAAAWKPGSPFPDDAVK